MSGYTPGLAPARRRRHRVEPPPCPGKARRSGFSRSAEKRKCPVTTGVSPPVQPHYSALPPEQQLVACLRVAGLEARCRTAAASCMPHMRRFAAAAARAARGAAQQPPLRARQICAAPPSSPDSLPPLPASRGRSAAAAEQAAAAFAGHLQHAPRATADALAASLSEKQREALMVRLGFIGAACVCLAPCCSCAPRRPRLEAATPSTACLQPRQPVCGICVVRNALR